MTVANSTPRLRMGLIVPYTDVIPRSEIIELVEAADGLGYESVWVPEAYGYDAITLLTVLATRTDSIQLGTGIINVFSRTPALIAQTIAALDDISGGRAILGLGTSGPQVIGGWHGIAFESPVQRTRETVEIVRIVLRRERLRYDGRVFRLSGGLKLITHPPRSTVPVAIASITDAGVALTAEVAERWMPTLFDVDQGPRIFAGALERGTARRDPSLPPLLVCPSLVVSIDDDVERARDEVRPHLALYLGGMGSREKNFYNALVGRYGFAAEVGRVQDLYLAGDRAGAIAAVPDEIVDRVAAVGPLVRCRERLDAMVSVGMVPLLSFISTDHEARMRALERLAAPTGAPVADAARH